jgi:hypothetical protein
MNNDSSAIANERYRASLIALRDALMKAVAARQACHDAGCKCGFPITTCSDRQIEREIEEDEWGSIVIEMLNKSPQLR